MPTASLTLKLPVPKVEATRSHRRLWRQCYSMARRMIRARDGWTVTDALMWFQHHAYRRFGERHYRTVIAAGSLVFHERVLSWGASGTIAELERQGLVRRTRRPRPGNLTATVPSRAFRFERVRSCGISTAFTFDKLAAVHLRRSGRAYELRQRREAEACLFAITPEGRAALAAATLAA